MIQLRKGRMAESVHLELAVTVSRLTVDQAQELKQYLAEKYGGLPAEAEPDYYDTPAFRGALLGHFQSARAAALREQTRPPA